MLQIFNHAYKSTKNRSGSVDVRIVSKANAKYNYITIVGSVKMQQQSHELKTKVKQEFENLQGQLFLFSGPEDKLVEGGISSLSNSILITVGLELIFGKLLDQPGFKLQKRNYSDI